MRYEKYALKADSSWAIFEFWSIGQKGSIRKRIHFQSTKREYFYNLAFGDVNAETDDFDDTVVTDNGDTVKVLATVASTIYIFFDKYPYSVVFAKGSTPARTRLYKIGISKNLEELKEDFEIYGLLENDIWEEFKKNVNYSAFYIKKNQKNE
jgi:hypothetical protein